MAPIKSGLNGVYSKKKPISSVELISHGVGVAAAQSIDYLNREEMRFFTDEDEALARITGA